MTNRRKEIIKTVILMAVGAVSGYIYYVNWGCVDNCTIRSNVYLMIVYGTTFGLLLSLIVPMSWVYKIKSLFKCPSCNSCKKSCDTPSVNVDSVEIEVSKKEDSHDNDENNSK